MTLRERLHRCCRLVISAVRGTAPMCGALFFYFTKYLCIPYFCLSTFACRLLVKGGWVLHKRSGMYEILVAKELVMIMFLRMEHDDASFLWLHALLFWCGCHAEPFAASGAAMQYPLLCVSSYALVLFLMVYS